MASYYSTRYTPDPGRTKVWRAIINYLEKYIGNSCDVVVDIGCGYGDFINNVNAQKRYAIDLNPDAAGYLIDSVEFKSTKVTDLSCIADASVDIAFSSNLLEHLSDDELTLAASEFQRILRPNGLFITMQPNFYYAYREYFDDFTHKKIFSHESLVDFFRSNGFELVAMEKKFLPFSLKSRLPKTYFLTRIYLSSFYRPFAKQMLGVFQKKAISPLISKDAS
ncbi:methyltransferase domain-containing protein [Variovorax sp. UC74_104]|uniref:methyltransferase domain-containing protein n=1 Tax=Variovorax sp. UC74_104 TaxID=3374555 RepID=UPI003757DD1E